MSSVAGTVKVPLTIQLPAVRVLPETCVTLAEMSRVPVETCTVPGLLRVVVETVEVPVPLDFSRIPAFRRVPPPDWVMPPSLSML
jgi:hypothetical protein